MKAHVKERQRPLAKGVAWISGLRLEIQKRISASNVAVAAGFKAPGLKTTHQKAFVISVGCFLLLVCPILASDTMIVYTPNGSEIIGYLFAEMSQEEIRKKDAQYEQLIKQEGWSVEKLRPSSSTYNSHGYAWHMSQGGLEVVIDGNDVPRYWLDGSYRQIDENNAVKGDIIWMTDPENPYRFHTAIVTDEPGWCKSKWLDGPLYLHKFDEHPFGKTLRFYRKTTPAAPKNLRIVR